MAGGSKLRISDHVTQRRLAGIVDLIVDARQRETRDGLLQNRIVAFLQLLQKTGKSRIGRVTLRFHQYMAGIERRNFAWQVADAWLIAACDRVEHGSVGCALGHGTAIQMSRMAKLCVPKAA